MYGVLQGRVAFPVGMMLCAALLTTVASGRHVAPQEVPADELPSGIQQALNQVDDFDVVYGDEYNVEIGAGPVEISLQLDGDGRLLDVRIDSSETPAD